ncbi:Glyceraldehyde-3-phosphate dehydrogenase, testis-specific [Thelohanellus kitauei]|uniref:Glyceraldehyde-3-phosphate dehydrogenase n=1 Tax=Thelohanellus kitauei TaxID=669202 RepID=A0A0C2NI64_THEKT|nr:Glyceraldehyde-3-phosphate dehydrogenase, testis-specific [Thelohanellus kitauei]
MKVVRVGINGGGRIGRVFLRCVLKTNPHSDVKIQVVAVNDPFIDAKYMVYQIKYDSTHGTLDADIDLVGEDTIKIGDQLQFKVLRFRNPEEIPWSAHGVDYVLESTGIFTKMEAAQKHIGAGAKRVIISAPSEDAPMFVFGVNHQTYNPGTMKIVSNASCTTNCLAPLVKVIHENFDFKSGLMSTIHAITATQKTVDGPSGKDWRAGRAASTNVIPASTGAAKAVGKVFPPVAGKLTGMAFRTPVINVSCVDLTCWIGKPATMDQINKAFKDAADGAMKGVVEYADFEAVSSDFNGCAASCIYDSQAICLLDKAKAQECIKLIAWYDNETGYSSRLADLMRYMASQEKTA